MLFARWRKATASTTAASLVRSLLAVQYYRDHPLAVVARAASRSLGAAPIPTGEGRTDREIATFLAGERGTTADAVVMAFAAGGARYQSIIDMRRGDITSERFALRSMKRGRQLAPVFYDWPTAEWIRRRLEPYILTPSTGAWSEQERLFDTTTTAMRRLLGARELRRAVARRMSEVGGAELAAQALNNTEPTLRRHYHPSATEGAALWARLA